ncbi:MAG: STAS domain-containing protein [Planctomycetota bacterium]
MHEYQRLEVTEVGDVTVVRFRNRRITEDIDIQELGSEMFSLVENDNREKLLLNFSTVEFLGSAALGKLITLDRKVKARGGVLKFSNIGSNIHEVFVITKLNLFFDIKEDEVDALAAF